MKSTTNRLIRRGNSKGSVACRESHKSVNCETATEWRGGTTVTRMKPKLVERQSRCTFSSCDGKQLQTSYRSTLTECCYVQSIRTDCGATAISGFKDGNRIRQTVKPVVITHLNGDCLNQNAERLWGFALENLTWQRSSHSSLSKGKALYMAKGNS